MSVARQRAESLYVLDNQIGKLVATLKKTGEYDNTVLMFTSDNGYFLGEHRMRQGKIWTHEPSMRVPFVISGPDIPHGNRYDPISTPDIPATILDLGGAQPPYPSEGTSVRPTFTADRGWLRPVLVENQVDAPELNAARDNLSTAQYERTLTGSGLRTAQWKYVRYIDGDAELYDLAQDPNELQQRLRAAEVRSGASTAREGVEGRAQLLRRGLPSAASQLAAGRARRAGAAHAPPAERRLRALRRAGALGRPAPGSSALRHVAGHRGGGRDVEGVDAATHRDDRPAIG